MAEQDDDDVIDIMIRYRVPEDLARKILAIQTGQQAGDYYEYDEASRTYRPIPQKSLTEVVRGISKD